MLVKWFTVRKLLGNRFPIKKIAVSLRKGNAVESKHLNIDTCKSESLRSYESGTPSADSSKGCSNPGASDWRCKPEQSDVLQKQKCFFRLLAPPRIRYRYWDRSIQGLLQREVLSPEGLGRTQEKNHHRSLAFSLFGISRTLYRRISGQLGVDHEGLYAVNAGANPLCCDTWQDRATKDLRKHRIK